MSKPIHVGEDLHKSVKIVASRHERPMKEVVEELLTGEADEELVTEINREREFIADSAEEAVEA